ncbi:MAG: acyl-CoA reductase [Spirosomaceae bacterium]|nr:acyl-CoA reductase [Spirosomataceae bacterium]
MKNILKSISPFVKLGQWLQQKQYGDLVTKAYLYNNWFTPDNVTTSLQAIADEFLDEQKLTNWLSHYDVKTPATPQKVGVVMAGNIPAVGFHDAMCVLLSGHHLMAKLSTDDRTLIFALLEKLVEFYPALQARITLADRLNAADAFIATGSDNTARYFEYYFSKKPHIIRRNRTSIGILTGQESAAELAALGQDVLQYFGLGCRNVAKVFVPKNYNFANFYEAIEPQGDTYVGHHKYFNNYEYNKSVYLINKEPHFDNGFLLARASEALVSPISVLFFEEYDQDLEARIVKHSHKIQCMVSSNGWYKGSLPFGQAQSPTLSDYADGVDTMAFMASIFP